MLAPCATARVDGKRRGEEVASSGRPREQVRTVTRKREEGLLTATYLSESPVIHVLPSPVTFSKVLCPFDRYVIVSEDSRSMNEGAVNEALPSTLVRAAHGSSGRAQGRQCQLGLRGRYPVFRTFSALWSIFALPRLVTR